MLKKLIILGFISALPIPALAGDGSGQVVSLGVRQADIVIFNVQNHTNKPSCSTVGNEWSISLLTENGKSMYALLLSAAAQKQSVTVFGTGQCQAWPDRETPLYIRVNYN